MSTNEFLRRIGPNQKSRFENDLNRDSESGFELRSLLLHAAGASAAIPPGWARLHSDARRMLTSATADVVSREALRVCGVYLFASQPSFRLTENDSVVRGIYRRTLARARHTCQVCGRAGRVWEELSQYRVLCARCAAPHVVAADLEVLEASRQRVRASAQLVPVAEIPARLVGAIVAVLETLASDTTPTESRKPTAIREAIPRKEFDNWCDWLRSNRNSPKFVEALGAEK